MKINPVITCHTTPIPHISIESHGLVYEYTVTFYEYDDPEQDILNDGLDYVPRLDIEDDAYLGDNYPGDRLLKIIRSAKCNCDRCRKFRGEEPIPESYIDVWEDVYED